MENNLRQVSGFGCRVPSFQEIAHGLSVGAGKNQACQLRVYHGDAIGIDAGGFASAFVAIPLIITRDACERSRRVD